MVNNIGPRLKVVAHIETAQNAQLKFLRKQLKKSDSELLKDNRMIGMMQCYHFFRQLWVANKSDQAVVSKGVFDELKDEVNRLYEKVFK